MVDRACQCSLRVPVANSSCQAGSGATSLVSRAVSRPTRYYVSGQPVCVDYLCGRSFCVWSAIGQSVSMCGLSLWSTCLVHWQWVSRAVSTRHVWPVYLSLVSPWSLFLCLSVCGLLVSSTGNVWPVNVSLVSLWHSGSAWVVQLVQVGCLAKTLPSWRLV